MQGFNMGRYHPPDDDPTTASKWQRPSQPTVRFETPFALWCTTCPESSADRLIGQGVRFNAYKTRVGAYYSTPIFQFRFKHTPCGSWIEIRTDPQAASRDADAGIMSSGFSITEGAKKRKHEESDEEEDGTVTIVPAQKDSVLMREMKRKRQEAFEVAERDAAEKAQEKTDANRIRELQALNDRRWKDPDARNKALRDKFRADKKRASGGLAIQSKYGLSVPVGEETEEDKKKAGEVKFEKKTEPWKEMVLRKHREKESSAAWEDFNPVKKKKKGSYAIPGLKPKIKDGKHEGASAPSESSFWG